VSESANNQLTPKIGIGKQATEEAATDLDFEVDWLVLGCSINLHDLFALGTNGYVSYRYSTEFLDF
jgi:hypothetical protein